MRGRIYSERVKEGGRLGKERARNGEGCREAKERK